MVTEMDERCRGAHRRAASAAPRPDDGIVGEEGTADVGTSGVRWVIDPIDGTTNYLYGLSGFGVSIAAEVDGDAVDRRGGRPGAGRPLHRDRRAAAQT